jgi:SAM-dependent methyltransferase
MSGSSQLSGQESVLASTRIRARSTYLWVRQHLGKLRPLRSAYYFAHAVKDYVQDPWGTPAAADRDYKHKVDPWKYESNPQEKERHQLVLRMLDSARGSRRFGAVFEVGCGEAAFTQQLASRCESLLAVDVAPTALQRARERCMGVDNIRFTIWDLRRENVPDSFDLIVVMDVLCYFVRPHDLRNAREKLVKALGPGGFLLVGEVREHELYEKVWWSKCLIRGGMRILDFMAGHPALEVVARETSETHAHGLFRKVR